jgi:hypothetical protein
MKTFLLKNEIIAQACSGVPADTTQRYVGPVPGYLAAKSEALNARAFSTLLLYQFMILQNFPLNIKFLLQEIFSF